MQTSFCIVLLACLVHNGIAPPPRKTAEHHKPDDLENRIDNNEGEEKPGDEFGLEYERYLKEVIDVLESDQKFKQKLEAAEETDIRSGKIAHELEYVDHHIRNKLDEVKRQELERLRHLAQKEYELTNGIDVEHMKILPPEHLDHENPHTFEIDDLKKLIAKVTSDLSEADKKRREEFKEYEMQKEFENQEHLKHLEGSEKEAFEKQMKDNETKHKQHEPLHHPGSKQQLEEVWEKQDHMQDQEFNPRVFFALHDLDGNGYWDEDEVKALFLKELDKMYQAGAPEDDMRERAEELERMREHVFKEADKNKDHLINYQEFLDQTKQPEFEKDPGWETVDQQPAYTHEEYIEFERRRQAEVQRMIQQGLIPQQPVYYPPPGYHHNGQQFQQPHPSQMGHQVPPAYHPDAGHPAQFQQHPGQPQYQQHPGQPQFQQHPGQPQFQQHPGQPQFQHQQHPGQPQFQQHPGQPQLQPSQPQFQQHPGQPQIQQQPSQPQFQQQPSQPQFQQHPGQPQTQQHLGQPQQHQQQPASQQNIAQPPVQQHPQVQQLPIQTQQQPNVVQNSAQPNVAQQQASQNQFQAANSPQHSNEINNQPAKSLNNNDKKQNVNIHSNSIGAT